MAFPATGMEAAYRNDGTQVANLFKEKHPGHFCLYNLTERKYDTTMFEGRVRFSSIVDHEHRKFHLVPLRSFSAVPFASVLASSFLSLAFSETSLAV